MSLTDPLLSGKATFPLVGVSFCQDEVSRLVENQPLQVIPEPHNPFDANAHRVVTLLGLPVGYIPKPLAARMANTAHNRTYRAHVVRLRRHDGTIVGAEIQIDSPA